MDSPFDLRSCVLAYSKVHGMHIHPSSLKLLTSTFLHSSNPEHSVATFFTRLMDAQTCGVITPVVCGGVLQAMSVATAAGGGGATPLEDTTLEYFAVIASSEVPRWDYSTTQKRWVDATQKPKIEDRIVLFEQRLEIVHQRMLRHPLFHGSEDMALVCVSALEGVSPGQELYVLGLLADGWLEDGRSRFPVDLTKAQVAAGYLTSGAIVILHAMWHGDRLVANAVGLPPTEPRATSLATLPANIDFFGKAFPSAKADAIRARERDATNVNLFVMSDVALDIPATRTHLKSMFQTLSTGGYDPRGMIFVFCGDFASAPLRSGDIFHMDISSQEIQRYTQLFDWFAEMVNTVAPEIAHHARFLFVPGPRDPTLGLAVLPQAPIPKVFTQGLRKRLPHTTMATNPCRLRIFSQEIVIFRDDTCRKMRRQSVLAVKPGPSPHEHVVKSLLDQSHLSPFVTSQQPVSWSCDHALRLFPLPHVLILCDGTEGECWESEYQQCVTLNPGRFSDTSGGFLWYLPHDGSHSFNNIS